MHAAWYEKQGPVREVLIVGEMPDPDPGPGKVPVHASAGSGDTINTDLSAPVTLAPGTYVASEFNHLFLNAQGLTVTGSITRSL